MSDVESVVRRFCDAWNLHDASSLAMLWAEDGQLVHPWGFRAVGRDAIREMLEKEHATSMAASTLELTTTITRQDDANAFADMRGVLSGVLAPNGHSYSLPHAISTMFVSHEGDWLIRTMAPVANPRT